MDGGFIGFIDFVGYPIAQGNALTGKGARVGGKKRYSHLLMADQVREQASLIQLMAHVALRNRITRMWEEAESQRQAMLWGNALIAIVAEI